MKLHGYKGLTNIPGCASIPWTHLFCAGKPLLHYRCLGIIVPMQHQHWVEYNGMFTYMLWCIGCQHTGPCVIGRIISRWNDSGRVCDSALIRVPNGRNCQCQCVNGYGYQHSRNRVTVLRVCNMLRGWSCQWRCVDKYGCQGGRSGLTVLWGCSALWDQSCQGQCVDGYGCERGHNRLTILRTHILQWHIRA